MLSWHQAVFAVGVTVRLWPEGWGSDSGDALTKTPSECLSASIEDSRTNTAGQFWPLLDSGVFQVFLKFTISYWHTIVFDWRASRFEPPASPFRTLMLTHLNLNISRTNKPGINSKLDSKHVAASTVKWCRRWWTFGSDSYTVLYRLQPLCKYITSVCRLRVGA